jgi:hypothetical protein
MDETTIKGTRRSLWNPYYMLFLYYIEVVLLVATDVAIRTLFYITLRFSYPLFSMGSKGNDEFPLKIDSFFSPSVKSIKYKTY